LVWEKRLEDRVYTGFRLHRYDSMNIQMKRSNRFRFNIGIRIVGNEYTATFCRR